MNAQYDALGEHQKSNGVSQPPPLDFLRPDSAPLMGDSQAIAVLAALGHQVRLSLWRLLLPHGQAGLAAGTLAARMAILPSSLSFHLRLMTQAGVLVQRRSSRHIIYAVNVELITSLVQLFTALSAPGDADSDEV